jgi:hypothetical protein
MKRANVKEIILSESMNDLIFDIKVTELMSDNPILQMTAMRYFQVFLSVPSPDIQKILDLKIVPRIVELMNTRADNAFQHHACWALINIATTPTAVGPDAIVSANGIEALFDSFDKCSVDVKIQALWGLTNIFQDCKESRSKMITKGILQRAIGLLPLIPKENFEGVQTVLWTLQNLIDSKFPPMGGNATRKCLKAFIEYFNSTNDEVKLESLKGIYQVSENKAFNRDIIDGGIIPDLIKILSCEKKLMRKEALRIIGNIAYTSTSNLLLKYEIIPPLKSLLFVPDDNIVKETCWIFSNICADQKCFLDQVFNADIFPRALELLTHKDRKIRREANYVVGNACKSGTYSQVKELVIMEVLRQLTAVLDEKEDSEVLTTACEAIFSILKKGESHFWDVNLFAILVDKYGGEIFEIFRKKKAF